MSNLDEKYLKYEYVYLLQEREFVLNQTDVYKIGKTKQGGLKRFNDYPKGSKLLMQLICTDCTNSEKTIINIFREKYKQTDYGTEYFFGNHVEMIKDIYNIVMGFYKESDIKDSDSMSQYVSDDSNYLEETSIIDTFDEFKKTSQIKNIIVTNKKKQEGWLLFKKSCGRWRKIWDKDSIHPDAETLEVFLEYNLPGDTADIKKIIEDLCKNYYNKNVSVKKLEAWEHDVGTGILNARDCRIKNYPNIETDKCILPYKFGMRRMQFLGDFISINHKIVGEILQQLLPENIGKYRELCVSVITGRVGRRVIYDCIDGISHVFIKDICYILGIEYIKLSNGRDRVNFKRKFKTNKNHIVKLAIIDDNFEKNEQFASKYNINNVILVRNTKKVYLNSYEKYINDNEKYIIDSFPGEYDRTSIDALGRIDIFYRTDMLFYNFVRWCC